MHRSKKKKKEKKYQSSYLSSYNVEIIYVSTSCFATCGNKLFIKPRGRWGKEKKKKKKERYVAVCFFQRDTRCACRNNSYIFVKEILSYQRVAAETNRTSLYNASFQLKRYRPTLSNLIQLMHSLLFVAYFY